MTIPDSGYYSLYQAYSIFRSFVTRSGANFLSDLTEFQYSAIDSFENLTIFLDVSKRYTAPSTR